MLSLPLKIKVYRNITKNCWSLKATDDALGQRVIGHASSLLLRVADFHVSAAGRERVRKEKRKNVHAWVTGFFIGASGLEYQHAMLEYLAKLTNTQESIRLQALFRNNPLLRYSDETMGNMCNINRVGYNPYHNETFVVNGKPIYHSTCVVFTTDGHVYAT